MRKLVVLEILIFRPRSHISGYFYLSPQLFLSRLKISTSTRIRIKIEFSRPLWEKSVHRKAREIYILLCFERTWKGGCHLE